MSLGDRAKDWAKQQTDQLRSDPKGWAKAQGQRLKEIVDVAPFSDAALERELNSLRERTARLGELTADERQKLADELLALHQRLTPGGAMISGAKIGLAASVLPVVGMITGPVIGSAYGVYRSQRLGEVRDEVQAMLRKLARG
ncbi:MULTISPECIES: hypothetical protein [Nannocystis]|jgi:hypothetical protein|uniref:Uncharacterized protein n=1 Tax=Nannocystis radixulma TaxID=2995305 RepID=A0ABT5BGQ0_9BACT|nr:MULTISPECIES: hypothetical protein [Nannocystis]MCY1056410.1 hypothetical protein [Nannocystis sp. SCPEA4]MDC0673316.1 hypothetical protein [Nannocystis radixulma]